MSRDGVPETPAIYCVHLPSARERRERMERRLRHQGLDARATFVPAIETTAHRDWGHEWKGAAARATVASHIECMRRVLAEVPEEEGGAIVCEDDVLFHNDFLERFAAARANMPPGPGLLSLGFLIEGWPAGLDWTGTEPEQRNLVPVLRDRSWGCHAYWITHDWARDRVERLGDYAVEDLSNIVEWQITHPANGVAAYPPLMIQEAVDSVIRPPSELDFHLSGQAAWPYGDYAAGEPEPPISPLANLPDATRTIGLALLVLDESDRVDALLAAARPLVSEVTVLDASGSGDLTASRNELAEMARGAADYLLFLDSDLLLEWIGPLPPLTADVVVADIGGGDSAVPLLVRANRPWRFDGAGLADLVLPGEVTRQDAIGLLVSRARDGARARDRARARLVQAREARLHQDYPEALRAAEAGMRDAGKRVRRELAFERALSLYWLGRAGEAITALDLLAADGGLPDDSGEAIDEARRYAQMDLPEGNERDIASGTVHASEIFGEVAIGELALEVPEGVELGGPQLTAHDGGLDAFVPPGYTMRLGTELEILAVEEATPPANQPPAVRVDEKTLELVAGNEWQQFALRDVNGRLESVSPRFRLTAAGDEEATGLAALGGRLILGFGFHGQAAIAVMDLDGVTSTLRG